ncbi:MULTISPECIES: hypothetical protein [Sphingomonadaceae]|mgnify:CR=1 FL=1|jgi:hypothetical protein|uniref:hypothetical protein n=1 Tax=Sphingomonadales TaxID=204457 RepID=UPI001835CEF4|nr:MULTISPECIES: hypothetical protein [Sphingomonadaceae]MBA4762708.1 hypothetical protein [Sphingomonas sp.]CAH0353849.1 hypothetical protein SPH9361_02704 [Sphingobium sp. CECT 9361]|tara:strand:+ start:4908 stop:5360 length:453 start_codon:yes stop_codon:yes gene_type:complete
MTASSAQFLIPIIASLGAALIAGIASYVAGRGMRSHEWKLGLVRERLLERQRLYAKFIAEADRNVLLVAGAGSKSIDNVTPLLALYAEISLLSTDAVQQCAKRVCDLALSANGRESSGEDGDHFAAKCAFVDAARSELKAIEVGARSAAP